MVSEAPGRGGAVGARPGPPWPRFHLRSPGRLMNRNVLALMKTICLPARAFLEGQWLSELRDARGHRGPMPPCHPWPGKPGLMDTPLLARLGSDSVVSGQRARKGCTYRETAGIIFGFDEPFPGKIKTVSVKVRLSQETNSL